MAALRSVATREGLKTTSQKQLTAAREFPQRVFTASCQANAPSCTRLEFRAQQRRISARLLCATRRPAATQFTKSYGLRSPASLTARLRVRLPGGSGRPDVTAPARSTSPG